MLLSTTTPAFVAKHAKPHINNEYMLGNNKPKYHNILKLNEIQGKVNNSNIGNQGIDNKGDSQAYGQSGMSREAYENQGQGNSEEEEYYRKMYEEEMIRQNAMNNNQNQVKNPQVHQQQHQQNTLNKNNNQTSSNPNSVNNYEYNQMNYLKNKAANQQSNITTSGYNFNPQQNNKKSDNTSQQNNTFNPQNDFNHLIKNKKQEQQMLYKNFLDSQVKERTNLKDNYKVNEFVSLNKKDPQPQTNPYTGKKYEIGSTNLGNNIISPGNYYSMPTPQAYNYQDRPVVMKNDQNNQGNNSKVNPKQSNSVNLQLAGNSIMK